jgi:tetratricopeptide (TPR) repeat protein
MTLLEMKSIINDLKKMGVKKEKIRTSLEKQILLNPDDSETYIRLCLYYLSIDDLRESMKNLKKALLLSPGNEHLWFIEGYIFENSKLYKNAFEAYYYSYRLGSFVARDKLLAFCSSTWVKSLPPEQTKMIKDFKESIC